MSKPAPSVAPPKTPPLARASKGYKATQARGANFRNTQQRENDHKLIARLVLKGFSIPEIQAEVHAQRGYVLSWDTVAGHVTKAKKQITDEAIHEHTTFLLEHRAELRRAIMSAWRGWYASMESNVIQTNQQRSAPGEPRPATSRMVSRSNSPGDPRFLQTIIQASRQLAEVGGLFVKQAEPGQTPKGSLELEPSIPPGSWEAIVEDIKAEAILEYKEGGDPGMKLLERARAQNERDRNNAGSLPG